MKQTFRYILDILTNDNNLKVTDAWKKFSIMDCIKHAGLALSELKESTLNACWRVLWPDCVKNCSSVSSNMVEYSSIIAIAQEVGGEGFDDLSSADIDELLLDKALETKEISDDDEEVPTHTASIVKEEL